MLTRRLRAAGCLSVISMLMPMLASALSQTATVTVTQVQPYMGSDATGVLVAFSPAVTGNPENCSYTAGNQAWIDFSAAVNPNGRDLYAGVLAGFMAGQTFIFYFSGCGTTGRPLVYSVGIY